MNNDLIINPYTQILLKDKDTAHVFDAEPDVDFFLVAPVPGKGLQTTGISAARHSNLHELFLDLSQTQFDFLDVKHDLKDAEREFLYDGGILVEADKTPQKPLFQCLLGEVKAADPEILPENLIVNPTFHFEPFSFENLRTWVNERHFSPYHPSAWIERPVSKIRFGYWLDNAQAEIVSKFEGGKKPPVEIEAELLAKLVETEILIVPELLLKRSETERAVIERARDAFQQQKYSVLRELLPPAQMSAMRRFYRQYVEQGFMPFGDSQVNRRFRQINEPLAKFFHHNFGELMTLLANREVKPSYVFAASYREFADLKPHTDRKQCEFSISFQVDYLPETENFVSPWALFIAPPDFQVDFEKPYLNLDFPAETQEADANPPIFLASGDALLYKGCEVVHYRYPLPAGHRSTSLFFHYVPADFDDALLL